MGNIGDLMEYCDEETQNMQLLSTFPDILMKTLHDHLCSLYTGLMVVYFQDKTATRGDGSFEDEDTSANGSEDNQGHPPVDWRIEDHGQRGQSRDSLFAILSDPDLSIPKSLSFVILEPIIVVMHFPSILPNPLLYLNIGSLVHFKFSLS